MKLIFIVYLKVSSEIVVKIFINYKHFVNSKIHWKF